jgi:hypothetical protein
MVCEQAAVLSRLRRQQFAGDPQGRLQLGRAEIATVTGKSRPDSIDRYAETCLM